MSGFFLSLFPTQLSLPLDEQDRHHILHYALRRSHSMPPSDPSEDSLENLALSFQHMHGSEETQNHAVALHSLHFHLFLFAEHIRTAAKEFAAYS